LFNAVHDEITTGIGVLVDPENQIVFVLPSHLTWDTKQEASTNLMATEEFVHRRMSNDPKVKGTSWSVEDFFGIAHLFSWRRHTYCERIWQRTDGTLFASWTNDRSLHNPEGYVYDRSTGERSESVGSVVNRRDRPAVAWAWGNEERNMIQYFEEIEATGIHITDPLVRRGLFELPKISHLDMYGNGGKFLFETQVHHYD
jgi:hypothetical protein